MNNKNKSIISANFWRENKKCMCVCCSILCKSITTRWKTLVIISSGCYNIATDTKTCINKIYTLSLRWMGREREMFNKIYEKNFRIEIKWKKKQNKIKGNAPVNWKEEELPKQQLTWINSSHKNSFLHRIFAHKWGKHGKLKIGSSENEALSVASFQHSIWHRRKKRRKFQLLVWIWHKEHITWFYLNLQMSFSASQVPRLFFLLLLSHRLFSCFVLFFRFFSPIISIECMNIRSFPTHWVLLLLNDRLLPVSTALYDCKNDQFKTTKVNSPRKFYGHCFAQQAGVFFPNCLKNRFNTKSHYC